MRASSMMQAAGGYRRRKLISIWQSSLHPGGGQRSPWHLRRRAAGCRGNAGATTLACPSVSATHKSLQKILPRTRSVALCDVFSCSVVSGDTITCAYFLPAELSRVHIARARKRIFCFASAALCICSHRSRDAISLDIQINVFRRLCVGIYLGIYTDGVDLVLTPLSVHECARAELDTWETARGFTRTHPYRSFNYQRRS